MSTVEHITFYTPDEIELPGLLYYPVQPTRRLMIWLHGMGDNGVFYKPKRITELARSLNGKGIALLAFNNRGAHNQKILQRADQSFMGGTNYELIADCVQDIEGAATFAETRGFATLYLAGHSTGANKICVYDNKSTNKVFEKYVLAGPGDDLGLWYTHLGTKKFASARRYAQSAIDANKPLKTMPHYSGMYPFSAQSTLDLLNPDADYNTFPYYEATHKPLGSRPLFHAYHQILTPMLVIAGSEDESMVTAGGPERALSILKTHTSKKALPASRFETISGSDHSFHGAEDIFANKVAAWLA